MVCSKYNLWSRACFREWRCDRRRFCSPRTIRAIPQVRSTTPDIRSVDCTVLVDPCVKQCYADDSGGSNGCELKCSSIHTSASAASIRSRTRASSLP